MLFLYNLNTEIHKLTFQDRHFYILTNREGKNMLEQSYYEKTDEIIELHGAKASSLIPVMQDVQAEYRYLPGELLSYIADKLGIPLAKAYSVATFYENFSFDPKGKYVIKVCDGTACHVRKSVPVREALEKGPYGRCVFHCDNDVVDHQVVNLQMENGITVTFSMCAFSATCNRTIKIMGTLGQIEGDMGKHMIYYTPFGKETEEIDLTKLTEDFSGHGGGDVRMVLQFCDYIMKGKESPSITDLGTSLESHYIALAAEKSRLENGSMISLKESACGQ